MTIALGGVDQSASATASLALNTWTHLAATYDGTTVRLFVNGVQAGTRAVSGSLAASTGALRIGGNAVWGEYFSGRIDEVRIYNRALSAAEIQADMNQPVP
jgi:hydrogenase maturation factor HypE